MSVLKVYASISIVLGLLGMLGNTMVLVVAWKRRKESNTKILQNPYLLSLTTMDLASSAAIIFTFAAKLAPQPSPDGHRFFLYLHCIIVSAEALVWTLVVMAPVQLVVFTLERYFMVVYPIIHKNISSWKWTAVIIACVWLIPGSYLTGFYMYTTRVVDGQCRPSQWPSLMLAYIYSWICITMSYFLPLATFIFCYAHMLVSLHKRKSRVGATNQPPAFVTSAKYNITITMFVVCFCFILLWSPAQIYWLLMLNGYVSFNSHSTTYVVICVLTLLNSLINPIIYVFRIKGLRQSVRDMLHLQTTVTTSA